MGLGAHREIAWLNAARTWKYRGRAISAIQSNCGARGPSPVLPNAPRRRMPQQELAVTVRELSASFFSANRAGGMSECSCLVSQIRQIRPCLASFASSLNVRSDPPHGLPSREPSAGQRCPEPGLGDARFCIVVKFFELLLPRNPDLHKAAIELTAPRLAAVSN